jgi:hypothetical protein
MSLWSRVLAMPRQLLSGPARVAEPSNSGLDRQLRETPPDGFCRASTMPQTDNTEDGDDEHR